MMKAGLAIGLALALFASGANAQMGGGEMKYCKDDVARLCPGVEPGGGRIIQCMKAHANEVSVGCAKELKKLKG